VSQAVAFQNKVATDSLTSTIDLAYDLENLAGVLYFRLNSALNNLDTSQGIEILQLTKGYRL